MTLTRNAVITRIGTAQFGKIIHQNRKSPKHGKTLFGTAIPRKCKIHVNIIMFHFYLFFNNKLRVIFSSRCVNGALWYYDYYFDAPKTNITHNSLIFKPIQTIQILRFKICRFKFMTLTFLVQHCSKFYRSRCCRFNKCLATSISI